MTVGEIVREPLLVHGIGNRAEQIGEGAAIAGDGGIDRRNAAALPA